VLLVGVGVAVGIALAMDFGRRSERAPEPPAPQPVAVAHPFAVPAPRSGEPGFAQIARDVTPAVVNISTMTRSGKGVAPFDDPFFHRFFGEDLPRRYETPKGRKDRSLGSGVIVEANGTIITNNHVVSQADEIRVLLSDKREFKAKLLGTDPKADLAVLKIDAESLQTIPWADSDRLEVGEYVLAVGNPFGLNQTVTMGIVSAVGRASMGIAEYEDFIQTDAAINPGNSGGALVNTSGQLVGINTAIFSQTGGSMGIGFAVPSNMARSIMEQLIHGGRVIRGWLGVSIQELTPELASQFGIAEAKGVLISDVLDASPAKRAGLERGDVIVEYDGKPVDTPTQLRNAVAKTVVGKRATLKVIRDRRAKTVPVMVGEQPKPVARAHDDGERTPRLG
jgi:serine protease Do